MAQSEPKRIGLSVEVKPHAYDPAVSPELFEGVLARRLLAFVIDLIILALPVLFLSMFIFVVGVVTFGLGFVFYALLTPAMVLWALIYYGTTLGSRHSATIGMRAMDIEMRTWYGSPAYFVLGAVHAIVFWITVSVFTPLILRGLPVQRAPALPARHPGWNGRNQQRAARQRLAGVGPPPCLTAL